MTELTWILDPATGDLTVEGLPRNKALALAGDLLPAPRDLNCARPLTSVPLPPTTNSPQPSEVTLRVARIYHASVVEGPGRRSVVQTSGCVLRCLHCFVPETHDPAGGILLAVADVVQLLLDPAGEPRDGVSILGGEPFLQPAGLLALLQALKARSLHTVVYTGYTLEVLARRPEPEVRQSLALADILIDGPFVASLAEGAGEWRGSRKQRCIPDPATAISAATRPGSLIRTHRPD